MKYIQVKEFVTESANSVDKLVNDWLKKHEFTSDIVKDIQYNVDGHRHYILVVLELEQ